MLNIPSKRQINMTNSFLNSIPQNLVGDMQLNRHRQAGHCVDVMDEKATMVLKRRNPDST